MSFKDRNIIRQISQIFNLVKKNNRIKIIGAVILLIVLSQWLMIKLVYAHKLPLSSSIFFAQVYNLKAGTIEEQSGELDIYLKDFLINKRFADKLLKATPTIEDSVKDTDASEEELSGLVWSKLVKLAWLNKLAKENNIEVSSEDIDDYINAVGGVDNVETMLKNQGTSIDEYKYFLIEPDILENKVYNHLITSFTDQKGVQKIQEVYSLLEAENGQNWDEVVKQYGENGSLSDNSFWLSEEELVDIYEPIKDIEAGEFSKIVQAPDGYIIWHLDSISSDETKVMREVRGLFVYAQSIDDFFDAYLDSVSIKKIY
ncbi:MAG: hypothetical protein WCV71_00815 [Patescibacteria group bacterium]